MFSFTFSLRHERFWNHVARVMHCNLIGGCQSQFVSEWSPIKQNDQYFHRFCFIKNMIWTEWLSPWTQLESIFWGQVRELFSPTVLLQSHAVLKKNAGLWHFHIFQTQKLLQYFIRPLIIINYKRSPSGWIKLPEKEMQWLTLGLMNQQDAICCTKTQTSDGSILQSME